MASLHILRCLCAAMLAAAMALPADAASLRIGGTGSATEPFRLIGASFTLKTGTQVEIIAGLGSAGGIGAAAEGALQLAISGRALSPKEVARDMISVLTVCTPYVLASSNASPGSLDSGAVAATYIQTAPKWPDGMPIRIVLRPKAESDNATMEALFPGMDQGFAQARTRASVPIASTDQDNADLAEQIPGSLIGSTYAQILTEHRALQFVAINGVLPGLDVMESGRYPFAKQLHVITARQAAPEVRDFLDFLNSPEGSKVMRDSGIVPCPK